MKKIKSIAYNNGDNIDNYNIIFGAVIRDKYFLKSINQNKS